MDLSIVKKNTTKKEAKKEIVEVLEKEEIIVQEPKTEYLFTQDYQDKIINKLEEKDSKEIKVTKKTFKDLKTDLLEKRNENKKQLEAKKKHIKEQLETFFDDKYVLDG